MNPGANDGQQPDAYVDVSHGSFTTWEDAGEGKSLNPSSPFLVQHPVPASHVYRPFRDSHLSRPRAASNQ
jgi:hypothetical protein